MSRFFPHAPYAEDQTLSKTILTSHVLYRGFQSGAFLGIATGAVRSLLVLRGTTLAAASPLIATIFQNTTGIGAVIGTGLMVVMLPMKMWSQTQIQWQDRSWRLLENQGQMEVDDWSLVGTVIGAAYVLASNSGKAEPRKWARVAGGAGVGSMAGVAGYMVWRYGVRGGKR